MHKALILSHAGNIYPSRFTRAAHYICIAFSFSPRRHAEAADTPPLAITADIDDLHFYYTAE